MSPLAGLALGVLLGVAIVWLIFSAYWKRWRGYMTRDMGHLQAKVKSVEATNIGLERQLSAQKTDLAGMRSKINVLETENRLAKARADGCEAEKQALSQHLSTLRGELAAYKSLVTEPDRLHTPTAQPLNGHAQLPVNGHCNSNGHGNGNGNGNGKAAKANGVGHSPVMLPLTGAEDPLAALYALSQEVIATPVNGLAPKNGASAVQKPVIPQPPTSRVRLPDLPPDQMITPDIIIPRPRMGGDRLEIIQGIGPALMKKLHQAGIDSFRVLAAQTPEKLKEVAGPRLARLIDEKHIIDQARKIVGVEREPD